MAFVPLIYENLAQTAQLSHDLYFSKGELPDSIQIDYLVGVTKRKTCVKHALHLYEIHFNSRIGIYYLSLCCWERMSIALAAGKRNDSSRIPALSNFPYLDLSIERAAEELGLERAELFANLGGLA